MAISSCRGRCLQYKAVDRINNSHYQAGNKRCSRCMVFIKYFGVRCPCCNGRLRSHPKRRDAARELAKSSKQLENLQQRNDYYGYVYSKIAEKITLDPVSQSSAALDCVKELRQSSPIRGKSY